MTTPIPLELRRVALGWLIFAVVFQIAQSAFLNLVVFRGGHLHFLLEPTRGLVQPTLLANLMTITFVIGLVVCLGAGQRAQHLGLRARDLGGGLLWLVGLWIAVQVVFAVALLVQGKELAIHDSFGASRTIGSLLGQLFGNALFEEIFFRAFLISQLWLWLHRSHRRLTWTLVWSQLVFALAHVPNRLMKGTYESFGDVAGDQLRLFAAGLLMAWLWLRTRNLLAVVAMHTLVNYPPVLFEGTARGELGGSVALITLVVLITWEIRRPRIA